MFLGFFPDPVHLGDGGVFGGFPLCCKLPFDMGKTVGEFPQGSAERRFRIHAGEPAEIDQGEQEVPRLVLHPFRVFRFQRGAKLGQFLLDLVQNAGGVAPVETGLRGPGGDPLRPRQCGEGAGDAVAEGRLILSLVLHLRLDPFPVRTDLLDARDRGVAEDVGMAPDHLGADFLEDIGDVEFTRLLRHPGEEEDLKEEVAELLPEVIRRGPLQGLEDLIGLLDEITADIRLLLRPVPGTTVRSPQPGDDCEQFPEFLSGVGGWFPGDRPFSGSGRSCGEGASQKLHDMQDGLFHTELADAPGELEVAAGIGRHENVGVGGPNVCEFSFQKSAARLQLLEREGARHAAAPIGFLHLPQFDPGNRPDDLARWAGKALAVDEVTGFVIRDAERHRPELFGPDAHLRKEFGDVPDL